MVLSIPQPYTVRLKFSVRYVYLALEHGWNKMIVKLDSQKMEIEDPGGVAAAAKLAEMLAARIKANPKIPKVHLDVRYEMMKKEEKHHQKIIAIAETLAKNGVRVVGYG